MSLGFLLAINGCASLRPSRPSRFIFGPWRRGTPRLGKRAPGLRPFTPALNALPSPEVVPPRQRMRLGCSTWAWLAAAAALFVVALCLWVRGTDRIDGRREALALARELRQRDREVARLRAAAQAARALTASASAAELTMERPVAQARPPALAKAR
jgi:hypothetical protein